MSVKMGELNFFSTVEDLIAASDEQIVREMGAVSPEIVLEYVLHLRRKPNTNLPNHDTNIQPPPYNPEYRNEMPGSSRDTVEHTPALATPGRWYRRHLTQVASDLRGALTRGNFVTNPGRGSATSPGVAIRCESSPGNSSYY